MDSLAGLPKFWVDLITIPLFSVVAGVVVNWTGVAMMFTPVRFRGFYLPGLKTIFPFLPRKVQVLPTWAPGGVIGYQGFIPARAQKMAALMVDSLVSQIGTAKDFFGEFAPNTIIGQLTELAREDLRPLVAGVMEGQHPKLWRDMSPAMRELLYSRVDAELPAITERTLDKAGENAEQLVDLRLLAVGFLSRQLDVLNEAVRRLAAPELRMMVKLGVFGFPFGVILALILHSYPRVPVLGATPSWVVVIAGAMIIGVSVNLIAIKVVFEPPEPRPRYRCPWRQARLAKRQPQAAADFGHLLARDILTLDNIAEEVLNGPRGDRTKGFLEHTLAQELNQMLGPFKSALRIAVGSEEFDAVMTQGTATAVDYAPSLLGRDPQFLEAQTQKVENFATQKLRALPAKDFIAVVYAMIEQDAWLLYAHGAALGLLVGGLHILIFGS